MIIPESGPGPVNDALKTWEGLVKSRYREGFCAGVFTSTIAMMTAIGITGIVWLVFV